MTVAGLIGALLLVPMFQRAAEAVGTIEFTPIPATYGVAVYETVTYTTSLTGTLTFTVDTATLNGMTVETSTPPRLVDTPTAVALTEFIITASNGTESATGTLSVSVCPQKLLNVTTTSADRCLPPKPASALSPTGLAPGESETAGTTANLDPHAFYNSASDTSGCAACHRTHADKNSHYITDPQANHATECISCHDGTGASARVQAHYAGVPVNDATTRSLYTHDAFVVGSGHQVAEVGDEGGSAVANEFQGVSNRHSDCVDCHNPHGSELATARQLTDTATGQAIGWSVSGATRGVSVVDVFDPSGAKFISGAVRVVNAGDTQTVVNLEYQLCMKCHSSFTSLQTNAAFTETQSAWYIDKKNMVDLAATNRSFHPVSRPGTNHTPAMRQSLRGPSAFKLWNFSDTDTVRCVNCHADGATASQGPGQVLANHATTNRGILLAPYQDRELVPATDAGSTIFARISRFALCFACHTDVPFTDSATMSGTNFRYHFEHIQAIAGKGSGGSGSIDVLGAGNGNAICAECHFRLHSTKDASGSGAMNAERLVNFAPNVETTNTGGLSWTARNGSAAGTCTVKCHGVTHNATAY